MKTIAQQLNVKDFPFVIKDKNNKQIINKLERNTPGVFLKIIIVNFILLFYKNKTLLKLHSVNELS